MRKTILLLFLILSSFSYGQNKTTSDTIAKKTNEELKFGYIGFLANFNDDLKLNQKLRNQNLPEQNSFLPEIEVGYNFFNKKMSGNYGLSFLFSSPSKAGYTLRYSGYSFRLNLHYNFINAKSYAVAGGASMAWITNSYLLFAEDKSIDMDDLKGNSGQVRLRNSILYIGPSVSVYLFRNSKHRIKLNAGYEFNLTKGKYHNYYGGGTIINNVDEAGNNRLVLGLMFVPF